MVDKRKRRLAEYIPRTWRASVRDTRLLLKEFQWPVSIFAIAIIGIGLFYYVAAQAVGEPLKSIPEALYLMLTLAFLQPNGAFPSHPLLQIWFFLLPLVGVGTLAQGLADFGILLFNRHARNKEWEMAVASTLNNHTILIGLGHLGFRIIEMLHEMEFDVVVIEQNPNASLITGVRKLGIPVIEDDATGPSAMDAAGVRRAKTVIVCTKNDSSNLQIALKARSINPDIQVVIRIFDEDFAHALRAQFNFMALSSTEMAAPVFAASAAGADITSPISVEGQPLSLARITIVDGSVLDGKTVGFIEDNYHLNIVLVRRDGTSDMHPTDSKSVSGGDVLAVLGGPDELNHLVHDNE